jgi:hypothetical protein
MGRKRGNEVHGPFARFKMEILTSKGGLGIFIGGCLDKAAPRSSLLDPSFLTGRPPL